ncbi:MAG: L-threonylcarbamoyladenylate synthase [Magnetovibrionaceae bacterium]
MANILAPSDEVLALAADRLARGDLVAFPTETVYGLGGDATNSDAVLKIFEAKGRPRFNPLISHVSSVEMAERQGHFNEAARKLVEAFWPGPLTLVVPKRADATVCDLVTAGLETVALRWPGHAVSAGLIEALGRPVAAPSANRSETVSPTTAIHVAESLGEKLDLVLDGGACSVGLESSVVSVIEDSLHLLRPGGITVPDIEAVIGPLGQGQEDPDRPRSPGNLRRHYAPATPLRLNTTRCEEGELLLGFGDDGGRAHLNLSREESLREAAQNLFAYLRDLDAREARAINVMPIPDDGLGMAINDRLRRAAS